MSRLRLGKYWQGIREDYPRTEEAEPLPAIQENVDPKAATTLEFRDQWRDLLIHRGDDRVVQLQRDRLQFNWRRGKHDAEYPRFATVVTEFYAHLSQFEEFVRQETAEPIKPSQYEVTYINHIFEGDDAWKPAALLGELLPDFQWRSGQRFLKAPERVDHRLSFLMPDALGRLHVRVQHAYRRDDYHPVLVIELTARGFGPDRDAWFRTAHDWIVFGFQDLTSPEVQENAWLKT